MRGGQIIQHMDREKKRMGREGKTAQKRGEKTK